MIIAIIIISFVIILILTALLCALKISSMYNDKEE